MLSTDCWRGDWTEVNCEARRSTIGEAFASLLEPILGILVCFNLAIFALADWLDDATRGWGMLGREEAVED